MGLPPAKPTDRYLFKGSKVDNKSIEDIKDSEPWSLNRTSVSGGSIPVDRRCWRTSHQGWTMLLSQCSICWGHRAGHCGKQDAGLDGLLDYFGKGLLKLSGVDSSLPQAGGPTRILPMHFSPENLISPGGKRLQEFSPFPPWQKTGRQSLWAGKAEPGSCPAQPSPKSSPTS